MKKVRNTFNPISPANLILSWHFIPYLKLTNHFMWWIELVLYWCSMRFLSLDISAAEEFDLLQYVATSLSVIVARSFETAYWYVEPWRWGQHDLSKCRANNTPEMPPYIREEWWPRSTAFSLEYVIVFDVYKTTSYVFLLLHHHHHHHNHHHHHHFLLLLLLLLLLHVSVMDLGHLFSRSGLTYPEVPSKVCQNSFCQLGNSVSLPWVIYYEAFYLQVVSSLSCIPVICPELVLFLIPL